MTITSIDDFNQSSDPAGLLDDVLSSLTRYIVFPSDAAAAAVALWVTATHGVTAFDYATRLVVKSPEKRCGKTRLLEVIRLLSRNPMLTANVSEAALFRSIGDDPPTLIIDEMDTKFGTRINAEKHEALRGLLNAGFQRGMPTYRAGGASHTPIPYSTFAMACLAGIGDLPDTIEDRAVVITLRRRTGSEEIHPFRLRRDGDRLSELQSRLADWAAGAIDKLEVAEPVSELEDRAADTWESLFAVADAVGGHWPTTARTAAASLIRQQHASEAERSDGLKLLSDIRATFAARENLATGFIGSKELVELATRARGITLGRTRSHTQTARHHVEEVQHRERTRHAKDSPRLQGGASAGRLDPIPAPFRCRE